MNTVSSIRITGARQHNLRNISATIPKYTLTVITGVSGSGKSSLAIDTLYSEGQRRYVESLSAYARQFLGVMDTPDVDSIDGLSPAVCIKQKGIGHNPRSTVGTLTEIYDHLRLLFSHIGTIVCTECGNVVSRMTVQQMCDTLLQLPPRTKVQLCAPLDLSHDTPQNPQMLRSRIDAIRSLGFIRIRLNATTYELEEAAERANELAGKVNSIEVVTDRLVISDNIRQRVSDSLETTLELSETGGIIADIPGQDELRMPGSFRCAYCHTKYEEPTAALFSFNSHQGACPSCHGLGYRLDIDPSRIVPEPEKSLEQGAIVAWNGAARQGSWNNRIMRSVCSHFAIPGNVAFGKLKKWQRELLMYGPPKSTQKSHAAAQAHQKPYEAFEGIIPNLLRRYKESPSESIRKWIESFMRKQPCSECDGTRLRHQARAVRIQKRSISDLCEMALDDLNRFFDALSLDATQQHIASQLIKEITQRTEWLTKLGVGYLTLARSSPTLSGGEVQRIRLAAQLGSRLSGVLYILDEPSVGLHMADNTHLIEILKALRDLGNTVVVIEHDRDMIMSADHCIDMGPGAGTQGGSIVAQGSPKELLKDPESVTGTYLKDKSSLPCNTRRHRISAHPVRHIELCDASGHNLRHIDVRLPLNRMVCVSGVSGSGKSSLVRHTLVPALLRHVRGTNTASLPYKKLTGAHHIGRVVTIDQSPIGLTPRSNPATYTKVFTPIRELFAATVESKKRGYRASRFSFNVKGGRCDACNGDGIKKVEMHFLPDVYVQCEVCKGRRYNRETLDIRYKGKTIAEVLDMTVDTALRFFSHFSTIKSKLSTLSRIGLGYLTLGQPATTLSGGEAQRIKLASELCKNSHKHTIYLLDEPTTGLHFKDISLLVDLLSDLVDKGNTVLVIEHNPDVIKCADFVIDLGPGGGEKGGEIVASGTVEQICAAQDSLTGRYLRPYLTQ